jgi:cell division septation protein DedD
MSYQFGHVDRDERIEYSIDEPPEMLPPQRHLPMAAIAAGAVVVFVGSLWFAYHIGTKHATSAPAAAGTEVPLIHADPQPVKVKPDKPGGMNIPDQDDPIYSRTAASPPVERLQPPPEKPAPRPVAPPPPAPAPVPAPSADAGQAAPQVAAVPQAPPPLAKPAAKAPPAKPAATAGPPVKIQLGSLRSPDAARDEWQRVKRENADLLGKLTAVAVRAEVPDKGTYYRIEAGPAGDRTAAERLCKALKERKLGCELVR